MIQVSWFRLAGLSAAGAGPIAQKIARTTARSRIAANELGQLAVSRRPGVPSDGLPAGNSPFVHIFNGLAGFRGNTASDNAKSPGLFGVPAPGRWLSKRRDLLADGVRMAEEEEEEEGTKARRRVRLKERL